MAQYKPEKEKNKVNRWISIILFILLFIVPLQVATQYLAAKFSYQEVLGFNVANIYPFWKCLIWYRDFSNQPELETYFSTAEAFGFFSLVGWLFLMLVIRAGMTRKMRDYEGIHGTARWAEEKDLEKAGLLNFSEEDAKKPAVVVGGWRDKKGKLRYLLDRSPAHVLGTAPTGSGKGVSCVVTTLLTWTHSALISDLKGELWEMTAGWRQKFAKNKVLRFEPASSTNDVCWNAIHEIRVGQDEEIGDAQNIALMVVDTDGKGLYDHWRKTSYSLLTGLVLHVLYKQKTSTTGYIASLRKIADELSNPDRDIGALWDEMINNKHKDGVRLDIVAQAGRDMKDKPEEEAGSVVSTLKTCLDLYRDDIVARNTEKSDFSLRDLMSGDTPVSLYYITQPTDKDRMLPLSRLFASMAIRLNTPKLEFKDGAPVAHYKYKLLYMWDELPAYGKLALLEESIAYVRGYGIRFYLITQDREQLLDPVKGYGQNEKITGNCHIQWFFAPTQQSTAEYISKVLGVTTIVKTDVSMSGAKYTLNKENVSVSKSQVQRQLMTSDEIMNLDQAEKSGDKIVKAGAMIIKMAGMQPIYGEQSLYFQSDIWDARSKIAPPSHSDLLLAA